MLRHARLRVRVRNVALRRIAGIGMMTALMAVGGCMARDTSGGPSKSVRTIDLSAFVGSAGDGATASSDDRSTGAGQASDDHSGARVEIVSDSGNTNSGADAPPAPIVVPVPEAPITHDGLIGQVNGRPIYADEILKPIENELRILGSTKDYNTFILEGEIKIQQQLIDRVRYELVYAEAEASLTENERVGLRYFLQKLEGDMTRGPGRKAEDLRLRREKGVGLDEELELERARQLVAYKIQNEVRSKVVVNWRDIERYYRNNYDEFNPPAAIQLRVLGVRAGDTVTRSAVADELKRGYEFAAVASQYSTVLASRGGLLPAVPLDKGLADTPLTSWPEVDAVAKTLKQGEYGGPVTSGNLALWVYVEEYSDGVGRSLYEAQHDIEERLLKERLGEEEQKYFQRLIERGNMDDFDLMKFQVLRIAMDRWAPPKSP